MQPTAAKNAMSEILHKAGAGQACITQMANEFDYHSTSGSASGSLKMLGGLAGSASVDANFQTSGGGASGSASSQGCSQLIAQAATTLNSMRAVTCSVQNASTQAQGNVRANASIKVKVSEECLESRQSSLQLIRDQMELASMAFSPEVAKALLEKQIPVPSCALSIRNSTLRVKADGKLNVTTSADLQNSSQLKAAVKEAVSSQAETELRNALGGVATQGLDLKAITDQYVESRKETIQTDILNNASKAGAELDLDGSILLTAPQKIDLDGSLFDASVDASLKSAAIMSAASRIGTSIAMDIIHDAQTKSSSDMTTEQLSDIVDAMGKASEAAIKAQTNGFAKQLSITRGAGILGVIGVLVVGVAVVLMRKTGGGYENTGEYNPSLCQGFKTFPEQFGRYYKIVGVVSLILKIYFVLFVLRQAKELVKHSTQIFMPWKWGSLDIQRYIMNVVWSAVGFVMFCYMLHNTAHPAKCFMFFAERNDPGNCYPGPAGDDDYDDYDD